MFAHHQIQLRRCEGTDAEHLNSQGLENIAVVYGRPKILLQAVSLGRLRQVRLLLDAGVNVNCKDVTSGQTALIKAMFLENPKVRRKTAKMLINYEAKAKLLDKYGRSAVSWACLLGREDMVKLFFSQPELDVALGNLDVDGNTNLILASMSGNVSIVRTMSKYFRKNRLDVNRVNKHGQSALAAAYMHEFPDCAEVLLHEARATPCVVDSKRKGHILTSTERKRNKPHTALKQKSCNLPKLFGLYAEQLTNSYPRNCKSGGGMKLLPF